MQRSVLVWLSLVVTTATAGCGGPRDGGAGQPPASDSGAAAPQPAPIDAPSDSAEATGPAGAIAVLREYYAAIQAGDHARAYRLWSGEGEASGQTLEEFRSGYTRTEAVTLSVGEPGRVEGAAGSRYIEIPVTVSAETTSGEEQCFRGTYVLRRSEVPGATEDQRAWRIHSASLSDAAAEVCSASSTSPAADSAAAVIREFGGHLASVSVLAPADVLREDIRTRYAAHVTPDLLTDWLDDPAAAPGREVSSPWPDRIEIESITPAGDDRFRASGEIVYITSTEAGTDAAAERRPVTVDVVRTSDGWKISSFSAASR